ncbi:MAG TPA: lactate utilization protein [Symbiobacteriaceae bacterium]|nr:lactate utilization protein [Symbiobacteriaceae bacterium]
MINQALEALRAGGWQVLHTASLDEARAYLTALAEPGDTVVAHESGAWDLVGAEAAFAAAGVRTAVYGPSRPAASREALLKARVGVTGATAVAAESGTVILAEDDGYGRMVSNLPYTHVVLAPVYKLVARIEDGLAAATQYARLVLGKPAPRYISGISGPSKTGDIEFVIVQGMHGPGRVHIILLDISPPPGAAEGYLLKP